ncbi:MAG: OmpA family protein [Gammaproteobacteria bacterium]|nr:OmpA family protein [Gammaproteobacteria bacterium]
MKAIASSRLRLPLALASTVALTSVAAHDHADGDWYLSPALNYVIADDDREADDDAGFQIGLGRQLNEAWNLEGNLEIDTLDRENGNNEFKQRGLALDGLYFFDRNPGFAPYALVGAGVLNTRFDGEKGTNPMVNAGLGFLSNALSDTVALRAEARYRYDGDNESLASEDAFGDWIISLGVNIPLGGDPAPAAVPAVAAMAEPAPAAAPLDSDNDGVNDSTDACPNSPAGAKVDARGCDLDSDSDGVPDSSDRCPDSPVGTRVDAHGCEVDSDGDGVIDSKDRCPDTAAGVKVDVRGCEIKEVIELPGVNFETGSAQLVTASASVLDEAAGTLIKHPEIKAEVAGHTDNTGAHAFNVDLSQRRAETVMQYLVAKGVPAGNLTARGYGPDQPVADNATKDGRAANRRVELRIAK